MNSNDIFAVGLGLQTPWSISTVRFKPSNTAQELHIEIGFEKGSKFPDEKNELCSIHDTKQRTWRHLNFFQHKCYLTCNIPRIKTSTGKIVTIDPPWARKGSGFTLLFEAFAMSLIENEMAVNRIGAIVDENPHRLWTIFNYWIQRARDKDQPKEVIKLGVDETSTRKGHKYITLGVDLDEKRVIKVEEGKGKVAIKGIKDYLVGKGLWPDSVKHISMDMSPSFISGALDHFPKAEIHFDRFHVVKLLNEAMDTVRKLERKEHKELKGHKYTFLKNKDKLSKEKRESLSNLIKLYPTLGEAYRLKELFNDLWDLESEEEAKLFLEDWFQQVDKAGIGPFKKFAKTVRLHLSGIINFCGSRINNGILEGINSKIQLAKRRARGYRNTSNLINMVYLLCGRLKFDYPLYSS